MASLTDRMLRAAWLDASLYEEVEADSTAMGQAMTVVVLSSIAGGIGASAANGVGGLIGGALASLVGWYIWAFLTYFIGTKWLPEPTTHADTGQMLRTIGFASAPGIIRIAGIIPGLGMIALVAAPVWMLCAMIVAVRQALDYSSTGRAVVVCVIGFVVQFAVILAIFVALGLAAASHPGPPAV
jgi:hypothetical protein